jgi:hypothetical protein
MLQAVAINCWSLVGADVCMAPEQASEAGRRFLLIFGVFSFAIILDLSPLRLAPVLLLGILLAMSRRQVKFHGLDLWPWCGSDGRLRLLWQVGEPNSKE